LRRQHAHYRVPLGPTYVPRLVNPKLPASRTGSRGRLVPLIRHVAVLTAVAPSPLVAASSTHVGAGSRRTMPCLSMTSVPACASVVPSRPTMSARLARSGGRDGCARTRIEKSGARWHARWSRGAITGFASASRSAACPRRHDSRADDPCLSESTLGVRSLGRCLPPRRDRLGSLVVAGGRLLLLRCRRLDGVRRLEPEPARQ
jgi:hypothetical protein